jgi:hypothetical protein
MAGEALGYLDYVRAAWRFRPRLGWLGHMPVNKMALAVIGLLGVVNPGFWLLGVAAEVAYLGFLSSSSSFQKLVQGELLLQRQVGWEDKVQQVAVSLAPDSQARYRRLLGQCGLILGMSEKAAQESLGSLQDMRAGGLNQLLWLFLRLLSSRELIIGNLAQVDRSSLEADVARLRDRLAQTQADSPLARSLQATLDIQSKRLENLNRARASLDVIDAELERIEQQVRLIREEIAVGGGPDQLSARLDSVTSTMAETTRWMDQNAELLGALTTDDAEVASLPRLPEAPAQPVAPPPPPPRARQRG